MENRQIILQELKELSPVVANLSRDNVFSLPLNYFENFTASVLAKIHTEAVDIVVKTTPFSVPKGYFDDLAGNVLARLNRQELSVEEELNGIAPLLNSISKRPVYTVPEGYFESLEVTVPLKITKPGAKVIGFNTTKRLMQYAVAACIAAVLMIGVYLYINKGSNDITAGMPVSYDSALKMNVPQEIAKVNEQEIDQYLNESPGTGYVINTSASDEIDVQQYIQSASDEEINQYLKESAEPGEKTRGT
jgi:hypothetical protein